MASIQEAERQALIEAWSPLVIVALQDIGIRRWPPYQEKRGWFKRPRLIPRFTVEGPVWRGGEILWAASHTLSPSVFDKRGSLTQGEREFWIVGLSGGEQPCFRIEGAQPVEAVSADKNALQAALVEALAGGPRHDTFYGNRGPLSQRSAQTAETKR